MLYGASWISERILNSTSSLWTIIPPIEQLQYCATSTTHVSGTSFPNERILGSAVAGTRRFIQITADDTASSSTRTIFIATPMLFNESSASLRAVHTQW